MIITEYVPGVPGLSDGVTMGMTLEEAKRIRAALSELDDDDLGNYGGILEILRKSIPQQWGG
jgi:hypothetical protein